jgi:dCTP deaminase
MSRLSAQAIRKLCSKVGRAMIIPYHERTKHMGRTFGLSVSGYDVRLAETLWVWPLWGRLGSTIECFDMPDNVSAEVKDKSTNARLFVFVQNTYIEPGWKGHLTLEITRDKPWPIRLKRGTPIAQIVFQYLDAPTDSPYSGKYQNQSSGAQPAILEK